jgi:glycosyltransferase involved in cell wall biosynthesis
MRIGVDIKALENSATGIARYIREILDNFQLIDHDNDYILFECRVSEYALKNPRWKKCSTKWFFPGVLWQQLLLPFLLKKHSIDLLWAPEQICPVFFMNKIKVVTTIHDCVWMHYPQTSQWSVNLIYALLFKRTVKKSQCFIAVSEYIKNDFLRSYEFYESSKKIIAVPNGRPHWQPPASYDAEKRQPYLFFAGNAEPRKNLLNLIKALELLFDRGLYVTLSIAGTTGWKNKTFLNYLSGSRVAKQVHMIGYCSDSDLIRNYLECKALVYPSVYEGFGLPVLEALSLDCLVLTSRGTVMEEIAGPAALYFNPQDPSDIAEKIECIFSENFKREDYLRHKKEILQKYSWEKTAQAILDIFLRT